MRLRSLHLIYALVDPRTSATRYVGQTNNLPARRKVHFANQSFRGNTELACWIEELWRERRRPEMRALEEGISHDLIDRREKEWIRELLASGALLLNRCDGGSRAITKALHVPRAEWLEATREAGRVARSARELQERVSRMCGLSSPAAARLSRASDELARARQELERVLGRHFPEWADEVSEALYGAED